MLDVLRELGCNLDPKVFKALTLTELVEVAAIVSRHTLRTINWNTGKTTFLG